MKAIEQYFLLIYVNTVKVTLESNFFHFFRIVIVPSVDTLRIGDDSYVAADNPVI